MTTTEFVNDALDEDSSNENPSVTLFRDYLRIKTVHPTPDYEGAKAFLTKVGEELGLEVRVLEYVKGKPIVLLKWEGSQPELPSILLNSHIDVVPVEEAKWTYSPFKAVKNKHNKNIYARGAQDMKCVGIQHVEAVRRLKAKYGKLTRTVIISFVPDEEIGGKDGMDCFVKSEDIKKYNIGFALDEGLATTGDKFKVYYGERISWWIKIKATGPTGHGSQLFKQTAMDTLLHFLANFTEFRDAESKRFHAPGSKLTLGDVTTVNINMVKGGCFSPDGDYQTNVIPSVAEAALDIRVAPTVDLMALLEKLRSWKKKLNDECGAEVIDFTEPTSDTLKAAISSIDPNANPWWKTFEDTVKQLNIEIEPEIFPAATDSRYLRAQDIPALGFSPMNRTPVLLHDHDEFLNEDIFLKGIDIMEAFVYNLGNMSA